MSVDGHEPRAPNNGRGVAGAARCGRKRRTPAWGPTHQRNEASATTADTFGQQATDATDGWSVVAWSSYIPHADRDALRWPVVAWAVPLAVREALCGASSSSSITMSDAAAQAPPTASVAHGCVRSGGLGRASQAADERSAQGGHHMRRVPTNARGRRGV